jgi:hypothetical protein
MLARYIPLTLALTLAIASSAMFAPPAGAGPRDKCGLDLKFFYKKNFVKTSGCSTEGLEELVAVSKFTSLSDKWFQHPRKWLYFAKHAGGYYGILQLSFDKKLKKGSFRIRAGDDPLVFELRDGTEIAFAAVDDRTPFHSGNDENICAFYHATKSQVEALSTGEVVGIKQFISAKDGYQRRRQGRTEDGRSYFDWSFQDVKGCEENTEEGKCYYWDISRRATCALQF